MNVVVSNPDSLWLGLEALEKLDAMYSRSLTTMIIYLSVLVVIIAVAFPFLTWFYQRKLFQAEESRVTRDVEARFEKLRDEAERIVDEAMQKEHKNIEAALGAMRGELRRRLAYATAGIFYLQASASLQRPDHMLSMRDFVRAAQHSLDAEDNSNIQRSLREIAEHCLPALSSTHLIDAPQITEELEQLLVRLKEMNDDGRFTNFIEHIENELRQARRRPENAAAGAEAADEH